MAPSRAQNNSGFKSKICHSGSRKVPEKGKDHENVVGLSNFTTHSGLSALGIPPPCLGGTEGLTQWVTGTTGLSA